MLSRTQQDELFRNGLVLTARYYLELLQDEAARKILSPLPLEPQLPAYSARLFVRQVQKDCEKAKREELESWFESWLGEAARTDHIMGAIARLAKHLKAAELAKRIEEDLMDVPPLDQ